MGLDISEQGAGLFEELTFLACGGLVAKLCPTLATPWTVARQAPLSMEFSRQEYWSGIAISSSKVSSQLKDQTWVSCISCSVGELFITKPPGKPIFCTTL